MTVEDMTDLLEVYDAVCELGDVVAKVFVASVNGILDDSIYGRLLRVERIIHRNSIPEMGFSADVDYPIGAYVSRNSEYTTSERAKVLLGKGRIFQIPDINQTYNRQITDDSPNERPT